MYFLLHCTGTGRSIKAIENMGELVAEPASQASPSLRLFTMTKPQQIPGDNIVNLSSLVELKLIDILQDGRHATELPSSYVVDVRRKTNGSRPARSAGKCVLKTVCCNSTHTKY